MASFPPVLIMVVAAVLVALSPLSIVRKAIAVVAPLLVLAQLIWGLEAGDSVTLTWLALELEPLRADKLSIVFGYVFAIAAALGGIYAWHLEDRYQQAAALGYAGTSIGVVFAGDLLTLVLFWELMALTSAYLIWAGGYPGSRAAGTRYLFVHMVGGSTLLAGVLWHLGTGGSLDFSLFEGSVAGWLALGGFAINAAIVPLHAWLTDAYPEAGVTGSVFLSAFTTKTAVYVLARGFAGWEVLIFLGVIMALYGVVFAVLENDIRRLLAYHIISQVGYMVAGVGIGTEIAINGAVSHAFAHVIYKGLLFMGAGAAVYATGRRTLTALGGISDRMRLVVVLYMVGAFAISAFPLFSGFVSKSLVVYAAEKEHIYWAVALLYLASVGTFLHTGLKLPYFTWFGPRRDDIHVGPVPRGMIVAMVLAAALCIGIGVYPTALYDQLPYLNTYEPYYADHVVRTLQMLGFTAVGFWLLRGKLGGEATITIDTDWVYRKAGSLARVLIQTPLEAVFTFFERLVGALTRRASALAIAPATGWARLLLLSAYARERGPDDALAFLGRPPVGIALAAVLLTFVVVVLAAQALGG
ncbi:MAG: Na(+)/H(+) antiporter subunit D [Chloroflexi bacterium]|nr:Na(+)/H(+) antiporter subunit D [Chloroflexota bacterium]